MEEINVEEIKEVIKDCALVWRSVCGAQGWDPKHLYEFERLEELFEKLNGSSIEDDIDKEEFKMLLIWEDQK